MEETEEKSKSAAPSGKWKCPITKKCTNQRRHRVCLSCSYSGRQHCWDCCEGTRPGDTCRKFCPEPPVTADSDYDTPDEEGDSSA